MEEKKTKTRDGITYVRGKCSVCKQCWIAINGSPKGMCEYGGPFEGYVKDSDHPSLDKPTDK